MVWKPEDALEKQREDFVKEALGREKPVRQLCDILEFTIYYEAGDLMKPKLNKKNHHKETQ